MRKSLSIVRKQSTIVTVPNIGKEPTEDERPMSNSKKAALFLNPKNIKIEAVDLNYYKPLAFAGYENLGSSTISIESNKVDMFDP